MPACAGRLSTWRLAPGKTLPSSLDPLLHFTPDFAKVGLIVRIRDAFACAPDSSPLRYLCNASMPVCVEYRERA